MTDWAAEPETVDAEPIPAGAPSSRPTAGDDTTGEPPVRPTSAGTGGLGPARVASIVVGVVVAALVVLFAVGRDAPTDGVTTLLGARTPPVEGALLDGSGTYDIDDHRGSWVLVNFFATWCPPCVAEHPELVELQRWGAERGGLELVSVVFNDPPELVEVFFEQRGGDWPVIDNPAVPVEFQVTQIPESFLISPSGQVVLHVEGQLRASEIRQLIEERS
jgi:cytochrome c biogenesis protein CcmG/thiol:disulfide interchange protein DsbE